jgi:hypothetical protein
MKGTNQPMIDPTNLTLADLLRFEIFVPFLVLVWQGIKKGLPHLDEWPFLTWAVVLSAAALELLIAWVVGQVGTGADAGTHLVRGLLAGMAACGLYDLTAGTVQRVQERAAARNAAAYRG